MTRWPTYTVIITSLVLMQIHSMQFWYELVGIAGLAWSIAAEGAALWLWWQDRKGLAVVASLLLISGAFLQISEKTVDGMLAAGTSAALVADAQAEIQQLEGSLSSHEANSREKLGWAKRIDGTQTELTAARERYRLLLTAPEASRSTLRDIGSLVLQGLLLFWVMVTQIVAVQTLRAPRVAAPIPRTPPTPRERSAPMEARSQGRTERRGERQERKASPPVITATASDYDRLVSAVANAIETIIGAEGESRKSGREIADQCDVRPADVSMVRNHDKRKAAGQELISEPALRKLANGLGIEESKGATA